MNCLLLIAIIIFLSLDHYITKRDKYIFIACVLLSFVLNLNEYINEILSQPENLHMVLLRTLRSYIGYIGRPLLLWGLWELLRGKKNKWIRLAFLLLAVVNIIVFNTCFTTGLSFYIDPVTYGWQRGPWGLFSHYIMVVMIILILPTLYDMCRNSRINDFLMGAFSLLAVLVSVYIDTEYDKNILPSTITFICLLYFVFLHMEMEREFTKALIIAQKAELMMMQIKPHFINNTLSTIQALCEIDPPLAAHTTGNFARYLRMNLTAMDKTLPISINDELEHTKTYLEIEMLRFPWIEVEYDIQDTEFRIPALSIQPLVENAIQHGLRKQKHGKVWIGTQKMEKGHLVMVSDNGSGFDEKNPVTQENHGVGLRNVRYRIETVCNGSMRVESNSEKGTTITIYIPE